MTGRYKSVVLAVAAATVLLAVPAGTGAEDDFSRLLQQVIEQPDNPAGHYAIGKWYAEHGQFKEAVAELTLGSSAPGRDGADAVHRLILCLLQLGDAEKANQWGRKAVDRFGPQPETLVLALKAALAAKDSATAAERVSQIAAELSRDVPAADREHYRRAVEEALESDALVPAARYNLWRWTVSSMSREPQLAARAARHITSRTAAESGVSLDLVDTAYQVLRRIGDDTDRIRASFVYSGALAARSRWRDAAAVLIDLDARYESVSAQEDLPSRIAGLLRQASDSAAAVGWLEKSWKRERNSAERGLRFASALAETREPGRALTVAAAFSKPGSPPQDLVQIRSILDKVLPEAASNPALQKHMEPFLEAIPDMLPIHRFAAQRLEREGKMEDALARYELLVSGDAGDRQTRAAAARLAAKLNRWPDARRLLQDHPDADPALLAEAQFRWLDAKQRTPDENLLFVRLLSERGEPGRAWAVLKTSGLSLLDGLAPVQVESFWSRASDTADRIALARHLAARFTAPADSVAATRWSKRLLDLEPASLDAWRMHIHTMLRVGRRHEAGDIIARAVDAGHRDLLEEPSLRALYSGRLLAHGDSAAALQIELARADSETDHSALWLIAELLKTQGRHAEALTVYRKLAALSPAGEFSDSAHVRLAVYFSERGEFKNAGPHLARAVDGPAADDSVYFYWALDHWQARRPLADPDAVIDRLKKLKARPTDGIRLAGLFEFERGNLVSASAALLYCLNKNPKDAAAAYWMASALKRRGKIDEAVDVLKPVAGQHPLVNALLAELFEIRGDTAAALSWWLKSGADPHILTHAAWLAYQSEDYRQTRRLLDGLTIPSAGFLDAAAALKLFESGVRNAALPPGAQRRLLEKTGEWERLDRPAHARPDGKPDLDRAGRLLEQGNPHAAYQVIDRMEAHGSEIGSMGRWIRGRAAFELGWYERAEQELSAARETIPQARDDLAALWLLKDDARAALNLLESGPGPDETEADPRRASILAVALARAGRLDDADSVLAAAGHPAPIGVRYNRARLMEHRGETARAAELHQTIIADSPVFFPSVHRMAELAFQRGQWQSASIHFRHLIAIPSAPPQLIADARRKLLEIEVLLAAADGN